MLWKYTILKFQCNREADSRTFTSLITERVEIILHCIINLCAKIIASTSIKFYTKQNVLNSDGTDNPEW